MPDNDRTGLARRWGLRLRFALFFAALAAGGTALICGALWFAYVRMGGPVEGYVTAGVISSLGLWGLCVWIGSLFDDNVAKPILSLSSDLETRARANISSVIDGDTARYLGALAPAAQAIDRALGRARGSLEQALADKMAATTRDKALLEALLRELSDGVVVLSEDGRILLYNHSAAHLLDGLGLNRPISRFLCLDPILEALDAPQTGANAAPFLTTTVQARDRETRMVRGTVTAATLAEERKAFVLHFRDMTEDLRTHAALERLLRQLIEEARRPTSAMQAIMEILRATPDLSPQEQAQFSDALDQELKRLSAGIRAVSLAQTDLTTQYWPRQPVSVNAIFAATASQRPGRVQFDPLPQQVFCDAYAITRILIGLTDRLTQAGHTELTLSAQSASGEARLLLSWRGTSLPFAALSELLAHPLAEAYGPYTGQDALDAHQTDIWIESDGAQHQVVLPLPATNAPTQTAGAGAREFYDFDLSSHGDREDMLLRDLEFVIFDTETTGLNAGSDQVVQLAGIRIVNGRLLRSETFDHLVNPGRPIPPGSTEFHKITDAMVADAPTIGTVLDAFETYTDDAILVAHHASFDMAFLHREGRFPDMPALCTARLSEYLFSHSEDHTLDGLAQRLGVEIPDALRHTALGDAVATAEVFLHMLPLLRAKGIDTLAKARAISTAAKLTG